MQRISDPRLSAFIRVLSPSDGAIRAEASAEREPVRMAVEFTAAVAAAQGEPEGWGWDVIVVRPGVAATRDPQTGLPIEFDATFIQAAIAGHVFDGTHVFVGHEFDSRRTAASWVGTIEQTAMAADGSMTGRLDLLRTEEALRAKLMAARDSKRLGKIGLSVQFHPATMEEARVQGKRVMRPRGVLDGAPISVDVVMFPAAGGGFVRAVAALDGGQDDPGTVNRMVAAATEGATRMNERLKKLLAALRRLVSGDAIPRIDAIQASVEAADPNLETALEQATALLDQVQPRAADRGIDLAPVQAAVGELRGQVETVRTELAAARQATEAAGRKTDAAEARLRLNDAIMASHLPAPLAADVRRRFEAPLTAAPATVTAEAIAAEITAVRETYALIVDSPTRLSSSPLIAGGFTSGEKMLIGLKRLFGVTHEPKLVTRNGLICAEQGAPLDNAIPAFGGLREAYVALTGDDEVRGVYDPEYIRRLAISASVMKTASFPYLLTNVANAVLLQEFAAGEGEGVMTVEQMRQLIVEESAPNYKQQERPRLGRLPNLTKVDPEAADYADVVVPTEEKVTFTMEGYGDILKISRRFILNDDLGAIQELLRDWAWAAARTLMQSFTDLVEDNGLIYDGAAWFTTGGGSHLNLGATALSAAELLVIRTAFRAFGYKTTAEKIGLGPRYLMVPTVLESTARSVNLQKYSSNSLSDMSQVAGMFGDNGERIIINHLLADANDYWVFGDKQRKAFASIAYLNGRREPELFLADNPSEGQVFTGDWLRYKMRFEFVPYVRDFRNVFAEIVAN